SRTPRCVSRSRSKRIRRLEQCSDLSRTMLPSLASESTRSARFRLSKYSMDSPLNSKRNKAGQLASCDGLSLPT
ncbi:unnamed protein product, partial [Ectocarpus sp. 12 AP-2014]